jgi:hypothetical protein
LYFDLIPIIVAKPSLTPRIKTLIAENSLGKGKINDNKTPIKKFIAPSPNSIYLPKIAKNLSIMGIFLPLSKKSRITAPKHIKNVKTLTK